MIGPVEERAAGEELPAKPVDPGVQLDRLREPGDRQRPTGQPREPVGQVGKLGAYERPGGGTVPALGVKIAQGRLPPSAEVGRQGGQPLDRIAGVREEDGVGGVGPARGEERQRVADDRAGVRLDAAGVRTARRARRAPQLHRVDVHRGEELLGIMDREDRDGLAAELLLGGDRGGAHYPLLWHVPPRGAMKTVTEMGATRHRYGTL